MSKVIINPGGGGTGSDECTATKAMVLAGYKAVTADSDDEAVVGTLDVQSILSFRAAPYSATQIIFTWQNPAKGAFSGVIIVGKVGSYPTGITDGTRYYKGYGNNASAGGVSSVILDGFKNFTQYYFRAFSYALRNGAEWVGKNVLSASTMITSGLIVFSQSQTWTVPPGVTKIDIFCVGGGGGGGGAASGRTNLAGGSGGGGGYTATYKGLAVSPGQQFAVVVGSGGSGGPLDGRGGVGGTTSFGTVVSANGGGSGSCRAMGGSGGSGGGGYSSGYYNSNTQKNSRGGAGGSDGGDGGYGNTYSGGYTSYGRGQGATTRAFGEASGTLYAGGGGAGGSGPNAYGSYDGAGGAGGGANGYGYGVKPAAANTGGGGGGSGRPEMDYQHPGGSGGTGIVIIRA